MSFEFALLHLIESSPTVLTAGDDLGLMHHRAPMQFEQGGVSSHIVILTILQADLEEEEGVARTMAWLRCNFEKLAKFSGAKTLEITVHLTMKDGSRYLRVPVEDLDILSELNCDLLLQYSRPFAS